MHFESRSVASFCTTQHNLHGQEFVHNLGILLRDYNDGFFFFFFPNPLFTHKKINLKTYNSTLLDIYGISVGEKLKKKIIILKICT